LTILWSTVWFCFYYLLVGFGVLKNGNGNGHREGPIEIT
jgi:hypothetical protein